MGKKILTVLFIVATGFSGTVLIRNSDPVFHNMHSYAGTNTDFNRA